MTAKNFGAIVLVLSAGCQQATTREADATALAAARKRGAADAAAVLAAGTLLLKEYPPTPSPPHQGTYISLLREKCNCGHETLTPMTYSQLLHEEVKGWNESMTAALQRKFGPTILEDLQKEATQRWSARQGVPDLKKN